MYLTIILWHGWGYIMVQRTRQKDSRDGSKSKSMDSRPIRLGPPKTNRVQ